MNRTSKWLTGIGAASAALGGGLALWSALGARGAEATVPQDGALLDVPGGRLHYVDRGSGMPIVMLHGLLGQLRHFSYALADRLVSDYRVILIDRPGWGYSTVEGPHPTLPQQAEMVAALMARLALEQPVVVGHSMGGALALQLALDHPDLVSTLGLIAPLTQPIDTAPEAFRSLLVQSPALRALMSWTVAVPMGSLTAMETMRKIFAPDAVPTDFASRGGGALSLRPQSFRAGGEEMLAAPEAVAAMVPRYGEITAPTSILYGREDAILDPELHGRVTVNAIPDATLEIIEGGHMLPLAHPRATEAWLRRLIARRG
ncbi:alpha/beta fold hydrolase [Stakelama tenebrarum]|uniref:Alpha/beta hydrolase n=1 Tax=Stakelama tenebrarum TaxID=2711215 RepID=A0A6G6Y185_9SPHN|nr:alpha/beta hydrolase [Sphingosinithalassobacter tenebrarum]QIG78670.1 alpha/beta hydrolase [Sphingosinithalassobacter tenebrarum]